MFYIQCCKAIEFGEKTQNKGYYAVQGHSRSSRSLYKGSISSCHSYLALIFFLPFALSYHLGKNHDNSENLLNISSSHRTCLLRDRLHWLRVPERVRYKLCLLVFKAVHGTAPDYLSELCRSNAEYSARFRLRSAAHGDLQVPRSKTNFVDRTFAVAEPA